MEQVEQPDPINVYRGVESLSVQVTYIDQAITFVLAEMHQGQMTTRIRLFYNCIINNMYLSRTLSIINLGLNNSLLYKELVTQHY